jgi:hypothetical protein
MGQLDRQRKRWGVQMQKLSKLSTILGAALCAALILPTVAQAQSVRTIRNDGGGLVNEYIIKANLAVIRGDMLRIDGWCASACTAYLGNPSTCFMGHRADRTQKIAVRRRPLLATCPLFCAIGI